MSIVILSLASSAYAQGSVGIITTPELIGNPFPFPILVEQPNRTLSVIKPSQVLRRNRPTVLRWFPAMPGIEVSEKLGCDSASVDVDAIGRLNSKRLVGLNGLDSALGAIDAATLGATDIAFARYGLMTRDPNVQHAIAELESEARFLKSLGLGDQEMAQFGITDYRTYQTVEKEAEQAELESTVAASFVAAIGFAIAASESTDHKEALMRNQYNRINGVISNVEQELRTLESGEDEIDRRAGDESAYQAGIIQMLRAEGLVQKAAGTFDIALTCKSTMLRSGVHVSQMAVARDYLIANAAFSSGERTEAILFPVAHKGGSFYGDLYWPVKAKWVDVQVGGTKKRLRRGTSPTGVSQAMKKQLKALRAAARDALDKSEGGISRDSGVLGW